LSEGLSKGRGEGEVRKAEGRKTEGRETEVRETNEDMKKNPVSVQVKFLPPLKERCAAGEIAVEVPEGTTLLQLCRHLKSRFPALEGIIGEEGIKPGLEIMINGKHYRGAGGLDYRLRDGDELTIFLMVAGG